MMCLMIESTSFRFQEAKAEAAEAVLLISVFGSKRICFSTFSAKPFFCFKTLRASPGSSTEGQS